MNIVQLRAFIESKHRPELAEQPGMVYQVWEDGELTLQKSGELLWQRTLHQISGPVITGWQAVSMPCQYGPHGFVTVASKEDAEQVRQAMQQWQAGS